jgi:hypothetical protein
MNFNEPIDEETNKNSVKLNEEDEGNQEAVNSKEKMQGTFKLEKVNYFSPLSNENYLDAKMTCDTFKESKVELEEGIIFRNGVNIDRVDLTLRLVGVIKDLEGRIDPNLGGRYKQDIKKGLRYASINFGFMESIMMKKKGGMNVSTMPLPSINRGDEI